MANKQGEALAGESAFTRQLRMHASTISSAAPDISPVRSPAALISVPLISEPVSSSAATQSGPGKVHLQLISLFWLCRLDYAILARMYTFMDL
jgi:hypothetical protein